MLNTLLKYDLRATRRLNILLLISAVISSLVGSGGINLCIAFISPDNVDSFGIFLAVAGLLIFFAAVFMAIAAISVIMILVFYRFYKNLYTDEGYLTFTLPVKRGDILLSKTLNAIIWIASSVATAIICFFIFALTAPFDGDAGTVITTTILADLGGGMITAYISLALLLSIASIFFYVNLAHFCITLGSVVAKKHKLLAGIGFYYLTSTVISLIGQLISWGIIVFIGFFSESLYITYLIILVALVILIGVAAVMFYIFTYRLMTRKLNLA